MSRSYRRPYSAVTGTASAKADKVQAARGVKRRQNTYARRVLAEQSWDAFLVPHRLECSGNDVWTWGRDGKQQLQFPYPRHARPGLDDDFEAAYQYWLKLQRK